MLLSCLGPCLPSFCQISGGPCKLSSSPESEPAPRFPKAFIKVFSRFQTPAGSKTSMMDLAKAEEGGLQWFAGPSPHRHAAPPHLACLTSPRGGWECSHCSPVTGQKLPSAESCHKQSGHLRKWKCIYEWEWGARDCFAVEFEGQGLQLFDSHQYSRYSRTCVPRQGDPGSAVLDAAGAAVGTRRKFSLEDKPKKKFVFP